MFSSTLAAGEQHTYTKLDNLVHMRQFDFRIRFTIRKDDILDLLLTICMDFLIFLFCSMSIYLKITVS